MNEDKRDGGGRPGDEAPVGEFSSAPPAPKPVAVAELHVVLLSDGSFNVTGPLDNPFHFYGLLGLASDALRTAQARAAAPQIDLSAATKGPGFLKRLLAGKREAQGILKR